MAADFSAISSIVNTALQQDPTVAQSLRSHIDQRINELLRSDDLRRVASEAATGMIQAMPTDA
eukprot:8888979-Lingulodinium_polyedra.AAC.1